jgi:hypothetical protein
MWRFKMKKNDAELIVKIIAILGMIASVIGIIMGILMIFVGPIAQGFVTRTGVPFSGVIVGALAALGIIAILFSIFAFIVCMNLFRFREWARIAAIVFASIGVLNSLMMLPFGIVGLVLHGGVLYLLAFNEDIKKIFK